MMKFFGTILLLSLSIRLMAASPEVMQFRRMMELSATDEQSARTFYKSTREIGEQSPAILLGYKGMSELMMCNHLGNPLQKLAYFKKGKALLEKAIRQDANNAELRFMRFCVQKNAPALLNYSNKLEEDRAFLMRFLRQAPSADKRDVAFSENIRRYFIETGVCRKDEI